MSLWRIAPATGVNGKIGPVTLNPQQFGDSPEEKAGLERLADLITGGPSRSHNFLPTAEEQYGGMIEQRHDGSLHIGGNPVDRLYRIVDPSEWNDAQTNGYLSSNAASGAGYTRASAKPDETWRNQKGNGGHTLEIQVHPDDQWRASASGYAATHAKIPLSRVKRTD